MEEAGLEFRATKDLDIVLCLESMDGAFVKAFWEFVKNEGYKNLQKSTGKKLFCRFHDPDKDAYPWMLELFSRTPDALDLEGEHHLTPIPVDGELSSLSAILMDGAYYGFIHEFKREIEGLMAVTPECLVPLKAKAWLDLTGRQAKGEKVDGRDIKKHRNDVFRLFQLLAPETRVPLPASIGGDLNRFLESVEADPREDLKPFGPGRMPAAVVLEKLRAVYGVSNRL
jgi:hypothetical protein